MPHFSRLTDIVTCNLTTLLSRNNNSVSFLQEIIREMNEGVAGAQRCVNTAIANVARLESEIGEQRVAVSDWIIRAQAALRREDESQARLSLERKHEVEDLIAGLEQQLQAAISTREHLNTMFNALQARLADAMRRLQELSSGCDVPPPAAAQKESTPDPLSNARKMRVESELEQLRREVHRSSPK